MCSCSVVQESMWWNGNQIRDSGIAIFFILEHSTNLDFALSLHSLPYMNNDTMLFIYFNFLIIFYFM